MVAPSELPFAVICGFFAACQKAESTKKLKHMIYLREQFFAAGSDQLYDVYRLILPQVCMRGKALVRVSSRLAACEHVHEAESVIRLWHSTQPQG